MVFHPVDETYWANATVCSALAIPIKLALPLLTMTIPHAQPPNNPPIVPQTGRNSHWYLLFSVKKSLILSSKRFALQSILLLFYFQSFHASSVEFHILVFTTKVYKYWIATWYLMSSESEPIQKINHIESSFFGLCKAVRNAIADSPTGRSLQSL